MPLIIACPSCGGKLRITEALYGQKVRCPTCNHTFDGPGEPPPQDAPRAPQDLPLDLSLDEPSSPSQFAPPGSLVGAVEVQSSGDNPPASAKEEAPAAPRRPHRAEKRLDFDVRDLRRLGPRRDAEPDRGTVVLVLGIISLACLTVCVPIGAILGLSAWIMGQTDLRKMKSGRMDTAGRGTTQAGWICGILGTLLNGLIMLSCCGFIGVMWYNDVNRPPLTRPVPVTRPQLRRPPPPPKKVVIPQRNK